MKAKNISKLLFIAIAVIAIENNVHAQIKFGAKLGVNLANVKGDDSGDNKMKIGAHLGGFVRLDLTDEVALQPELLFSMKGTKVDGEYNKGNININYVDVPLVFMYHTEGGLQIQAGPYFAYKIGAKGTGDLKDEVENKNVNNIDFGAFVGAGYETKEGLGLAARFALGLADINKEENNAKNHNQLIMICVSYIIGEGD